MIVSYTKGNDSTYFTLTKPYKRKALLKPVSTQSSFTLPVVLEHSSSLSSVATELLQIGKPNYGVNVSYMPGLCLVDRVNYSCSSYIGHNFMALKACFYILSSSLKVPTGVLLIKSTNFLI